MLGDPAGGVGRLQQALMQHILLVLPGSNEPLLNLRRARFFVLVVFFRLINYFIQEIAQRNSHAHVPVDRLYSGSGQRVLVFINASKSNRRIVKL